MPTIFNSAIFFRSALPFSCQSISDHKWEDGEPKDFVGDLERAYVARQKSTPKRHFFGGLVCLQHVAQNAWVGDTRLLTGNNALQRSDFSSHAYATGTMC
jgi:hypothetical protein